MQKKDIDKVKLYLIGIKSRLAKNIDYFIEISMDFDGSTAKVTYRDEKLFLKHKKVESEVTEDGLSAFFVDNALIAKVAILTYRERGTSIEIKCTEKNISMRQWEEEALEEINNPLISKRDYIIKPDKAQKLLKAIGILTAEGKVKSDMIRKYNQIDHYVELVAPMFEKCGDEEIVLLDCACGKSYLSFVLNYYLRDVLKKRCKIIGIDITENVIDKSRKMAEELSYNNMEFLCADLRTYTPPKNVTAVISLHACDIATDLALSTAILSEAKYIACVPCCHKELLDTFEMPEFSEILKHGVFKARMNDLLTDGLRALKLETYGYKVSAVEYISPLDTPKNLLIRAEKVTSNNKEAQKAYDKLTSSLKTFSELDKRLLNTEF